MSQQLISRQTVLLQAVAATSAGEQKVLGNGGQDESLETPDVAVDANTIQGGWTPYQDGKVHV